MSFSKRYTFIFIFGFEGSPFLLSVFVTYKLLVYEICRQYSDYATVFESKKKNQFITIPFDLAEVRLKSVPLLKDMANKCDPFPI